MSKIHNTAIIVEGADLGKNVKIGPFCHVGANVVLGDDCILKSQVSLNGWTTLGDRNTIFPFACIGSEPQDLKYRNEKTFLKIGNDNIFREGVSIHLGTKGGGGHTIIGDHNLLMGYVHIAHDCHIGNHNILSNYTGLSGHCILDDHIILGGQNGVAQFLHIGSYVFTGGGSLIDRNIPPYTSGFGNRFEVKGVNIVGLKRKGFSKEAISEILETHRLYFRADLKSDEALRIIEETYGDRKEIRDFLDFLQKPEGSS